MAVRFNLKATLAAAFIALLGALCLLRAGHAFAQGMDGVVQFDIPPQSLASALLQFGRQASYQMLMASDDLQALPATGVKGQLPARSALESLLRGTGLRYQLVGAQSIVIFRPHPAARESSGEQGVVSPKEPSSSESGPLATRFEVLRQLIGAVRSRSDESLEEIVVSAQRLQTDVMHTPISLSAINGDELQRRGVATTDDLQFLVPALNIADSDLNRNINIRGIGSGFTSPNISQGVPIYRDGLLVPPNVGDEPLWDIESIQVLRGPQGTLAGANSTGGALFINTVRPSLSEPHGYAQIMGGDYGFGSIEAAGDVPIASTVAGRLGIYARRRDSYSQNLTPSVGASAFGVTPDSSGSGPGDLDALAWRASLLWQPRGNLQILGRVDYFRNRSSDTAEKPIPVGMAISRDTSIRCPAPASYLRMEPSTWSAVPSACGYAAFAPSAPYQVAYAGGTLFDEQIWRESLEAKLALSDAGLELRLLAGGAFNTLERIHQMSASMDLVQGISNRVHERTATYEADLVSQPPGGALNWVLGGFYWYDPATIRAVIENYSGGPIGTGSGDTVPTGALLIHANSTKVSYALFGNGTYRLAPRWTLEFGLRETWNRNFNPWQDCNSCAGGDANAFYSGQVSANGAIVFPSYANPAANEGYTLNQGYEANSFLTWKAAVDYAPGPDSFIYALIATGGKSGGIQAQQLAGNFAPEKDVDFETGWKFTEPGGDVQIQTDGFVTRFSNMQIADLDPATGQASIYNAGIARVYGLEIEGMAKHRGWTVGVAASYVYSSANIGTLINREICQLDAACGASSGQCASGVGSGTNGCFDYTSDGLTIDGKSYPWLERVSGVQLPNSPKLQLNVAVSYRYRLRQGGVLTPRLEYAYEGPQYSQIFDTQFDQLPARHDLSLSLSYDWKSWFAELRASNLADAVYPVAQVDTGTETFNAPRHFTLRVTRRF